MISIPHKNKLQTRLLRWFEKNKRDLPWRKTRDPYAIWVSETMLQQTQVATVIPYFHKFLESFPTVHRLAKADLSRVLRIWEGLGYYSRARNLHRAAKIISDQFHGILPDTLEGLLGLPGIGRYTAGALLSIAFNKEAAILDGNVKRVLSRVFAISGNLSKGKTQQDLWEISGSLIPKGRARSFNQALMELGATVCAPKQPLCLVCPIHDLCKARRLGNPEGYPEKGKKKAIPRVKAVSAVIQRDGAVLLNRRPPKGLLGGLWEFPNWRTENAKDLKRSLKECLKKEMGVIARVGDPVGTFQHTYSHFKITLHVYHARIADGTPPGKWVSPRDLHLFPMSRLHRRVAHSLGPQDLTASAIPA